MIPRLLVTGILFLFSLCLVAQTVAVEGSEAEEEYNKVYQENIKLTKIRGVYIPGSLKEAFKRLTKLTPPQSIDGFKAAPEKQVCKKLHFGIGRWMISNWNFYEGSRISHILKEKGLLHPDDMAQFLLRTYHRHLNGLPLEEESIIEELSKDRKKVADEMIGR